MVELMERLSLSSEAVRSKLDVLDNGCVLANGSASPPLDPADGERYARQLPYLAELGDERDLQRRLGSASASFSVAADSAPGRWQRSRRQASAALA